MANPNIIPGPINRLIASVVFVQHPELNVTPSFLMPEGIDLTFEGQATAVLPSLTNIVLSPEPFQVTRITLHLVKSMALAVGFKTQMETNSMIGDCTIRTDAPGLTSYSLQNCAITGVNNLSFSGRDAGYVVMMTGVYNINSAMWP